MGDGPPLQMWAEQDSWCSGRMGLHQRELGSENQTSTTTAWSGAGDSRSGPSAKPGRGSGWAGAFDHVAASAVYNRHFDQPKTKRSARTIPTGTETADVLAPMRPAAVDTWLSYLPHVRDCR